MLQQELRKQPSDFGVLLSVPILFTYLPISLSFLLLDFFFH